MKHIYYGMGKGKTSTLNGSAIRAKGFGMKVGVFRFLKGRKCNEDQLIKSLGIEVKKFHYSTKFVIEMNDQEKLKARNVAKQGMNYILLNQNRFDMIILDEFLDLLDSTVNFFKEQDIIIFLSKISKEKEILISGHKKYQKIFDAVDLVTHYTPEKHYFNKGVMAREGIEY